MERVVSRSSLTDQQDEIEFWLKVPMTERIEAVEVLRQRLFGGTDAARQGLQRVCRIVHRT
jgi:hypothetical protein